MRISTNKTQKSGMIRPLQKVIQKFREHFIEEKSMIKFGLTSVAEPEPQIIFVNPERKS
jgi:hypothetical protein